MSLILLISVLKQTNLGGFEIDLQLIIKSSSSTCESVLSLTLGQRIFSSGFGYF